MKVGLLLNLVIYQIQNLITMDFQSLAHKEIKLIKLNQIKTVLSRAHT